MSDKFKVPNSQYIMVIYLDFLLFQIKKFITSWLKRWKEKPKSIELISRFKYVSKISPLKKFHGCFLTHVKTAQLVVALIVLGKWCWTKVKRKNNPKIILTCMKSAWKCMKKTRNARS